LWLLGFQFHLLPQREIAPMLLWYEGAMNWR
jgi:hypothetical protein